ncbi:trk system potassium uptake protein TrkA [Amphibacillus marinus]|uniref:Trk system potassium uptake protein TrkA n=1 Tax=Amphibacillus marinus TaxID=872970 RepID=A0A1H8IAF5_9BACI|nr:TrkA family potassium uptake protein [Amphibacillus marinus]SEN65135.1 trk system potassium uptake protein TrkA [Amphibacillus marinus]
MKREFAVIGLGRFGGSVCRQLSKQGMSVLAIDKTEAKITEFRNIASHAVIADASDERVLKELGLRNIDHVIVGIGDDIQSSILITLMLKELGIKRITAKAQNDYHEKVLLKIGADQVIHPERDMGKKIAHSILSNNIIEHIELSDEYSIVEIKASKKMVGKTLVDLDIRAKYGCNVVAIKSGLTKEINVSPSGDDPISIEDILVIIGADADIYKLEKKFNES